MTTERHLAWEMRYRIADYAGAAPSENTIALSGGTIPVEQGQWAKNKRRVGEALKLNLYGGGGAGHLAVFSDHLLRIDVNDAALYGDHLVIATAEIGSVQITPVGKPVDVGEATDVAPTRLTDTNKQWTRGLWRGAVVSEGWSDITLPFAAILDVNGRVALLRKDAPIDWRSDLDAQGAIDPQGRSASEKMVQDLQALIDNSLIGRGQVDLRWVPEADRPGRGRLEFKNLLRPQPPRMRSGDGNSREWIVRLGLYMGDPIEGKVHPLGMRLRITSGAHAGEERIVTSAGDTFVEWANAGPPRGGPLNDLAVGDSYRLLRTDDEATIEWIVAHRGAQPD